MACVLNNTEIRRSPKNFAVYENPDQMVEYRWANQFDEADTGKLLEDKPGTVVLQVTLAFDLVVVRHQTYVQYCGIIRKIWCLVSKNGAG
jgi:hypothetical protein